MPNWAAKGIANDALRLRDLEWDRPYLDLEEAERAQADLLISVIMEAFSDDIIVGKYQVSIQGHIDASDAANDQGQHLHGEGGGRAHLNLDLTPVE